MSCGHWFSRLGLALVCTAACANVLPAQAPADARPDRGQLPKPVYKVAQQLESGVEPASAQTESQHPLEPALQIARRCMDNIENNVKDYTATMVKRERINGTLGEHEYMFVKVRQEPLNVYMYFLGPEKLKGQEVLYRADKNDGNLMAHGVGIRRIAGTVSLKPTSMLAMQGQRYPITEIGIGNLTRRLIEVAEHDKQFGECEVKFFNGAKINGRTCTCIQVMHPVARRNFKFHMARVFVDDELSVPVRYEAYEWPTEPGSQPPLLEEYTYLNLKLNVGLTDADFDENNASYDFN